MESPTIQHRFPLTCTQKINFNTIPDELRPVADTLKQHHFQAYLVGGAVRDLLRETAPKDWDIATDALPDQVEALFAHTVPTGKQYGTITVLTDGLPMEVTTIREDLGYSDGRRPNAIRFGQDIALDLARRDFTINAMAYDLTTHELVDPYDGRKDLQRRLLKAVGDPEVRFAEDGLRMLRFFRFLATMDLKPHPPTLRAIRPEWAKPVSIERQRDELSKILLGQWPRRGLSGLLNSGLLTQLIPEFLAVGQCSDQGKYHRFSLWEHLLLAVETIQPQLELRLAALFHDIAKPATRFTDDRGVHFYGHDQQGADLCQAILERLRYPGKTITTVVHLIRLHMFALPPEASDAAVRRLIVKAGPERIMDLLELRRADIVATGQFERSSWEIWQDLRQRITAMLANPQETLASNLTVNGHDLLHVLNLTPGPLMGEVLDHLRELVLEDPDCNQKESLLKSAAAFIQSRNTQPPQPGSSES